MGQQSFSAVVDGIGFTIAAYRDGADDEGRVDAQIWWDSTDGLGVIGAEDDEIDVGEYLVITFDRLIGLSHLFVADLFADESNGGASYHEAGGFTSDRQFDALFDAVTGLSAWGERGNGESVFILDKTIPVRELTITAHGGARQSDFALLGFTDPPLVSAPGTAAALFGGLAALGLWRRRNAAAY